MPLLLVSLLTAGLLGGGAAVGIERAIGDDRPATVTVSTAASTPPAPPATRPPAPSFDAAALYEARAAGVVTLYAQLPSGESQGSGFVVNADGTILTNAHVITDVADRPQVVTGATDVYVEFRDGERVRGQIVGWDLFSDVGVVRVARAAHSLSPVPLGRSSGVRVGEPVAAIGSPFGNQSSLSVGVVAATGRQINSLTSDYAVADAIQIDAPINHGNSGGPLFDARGTVIGINAQIRSDSGNAEGVGFAIPIDIARRSLRELVSDGRVSYAYIGITTQDVTPGVARALGLGAARGALISSVEAGSPAETAGLLGGTQRDTYNGLSLVTGGDLVVRIGSTPVRSADDISRIVTHSLRPGQKVPFTIYRGGERKLVQVTLAERPA
jgi:2-alkenal reductase